MNKKGRSREEKKKGRRKREEKLGRDMSGGWGSYKREIGVDMTIIHCIYV